MVAIAGALTAAAAAAQVIAIEADGTSRLVCAAAQGRTVAVRKRGIPTAYIGAIERAAVQYAISIDLLDAVARRESGYNNAAVSPKGAVGIMQLMPGTARAFGVDRHDPEQNIRGGAAYLRYLLDTFDGHIDLVLGAYNAGQNAILRYGGLPPYPETRAYVSRSFADLAAKSAREGVTAAPEPYLHTCRQ